MARPLERHIDNQELTALANEPHGLSSEAVCEAELHVASCADCSRKVAHYQRLLTEAALSAPAPRSAACPKDEDVDWHEVAAGLWPELKATQLIQHAALCDHCGPLLRAAASADDPTPQEAKLLGELKAPSRPPLSPLPVLPAARRWPGRRWLVPAMALLVIGALFAVRPQSSATLLSSADFSQLAVRTHQQHAQGSLALDVRSDSQQTVNEWFQRQLPFSLALPASLADPGEVRPNRLEGARLVRIGGKAAAYIAYQMQSGPVSLMVTPDSVAVASGGVEVNFKKVTFHYGMLDGFRIVTWSLHGLTYALVSQEGNRTQQSCMVCHSAMRDRDLSRTPPPSLDQQSTIAPVSQSILF